MPKRTLFKVAGLVLAMAIGIIATPSSAVSAIGGTISTNYYDIQTCNMPGQKAWITFDDGGTRTQARSILKVLKEKNVKGVFFATGEWARANPGIMRRIVRDGHYLGNHSSTHQDFSNLSNRQIRQEIAGGVQGTSSPMLLRPPYGSGAFDPRVQSSSYWYGLPDVLLDSRHARLGRGQRR